MEYINNFSLRNYNTFGVNSYAQLFVEVFTENELLQAVLYAKQKKIPIMVLGGGSNILLVSEKIPALLIKMGIKDIAIKSQNENSITITVGAGVQWDSFVQYCVQRNWGGAENLSLIPGTVGAAPIQNIGAYGAEVKDIIDSVRVFDNETMSFTTVNTPECEFGYRSSIFKNKHKNRYIITSVTFTLAKNPIPNFSYPILRDTILSQQENKNTLDSIEISSVSQAVISLRKKRLPDPNIIGNAGSFFKNPEVSQHIASEIIRQFPQVPTFPSSSSNLIKLSAAWLIEQCGWKGHTRDKYGVSPQHALILINQGHEHGSDIYKLAQDIIQDVESKFGVRLEPEVNIV